MIKGRLSWVIVLVAGALISGCATRNAAEYAGQRMLLEVAADSQDQERMLIWRASVSVEVANVSNAVTSVSEIATSAGGYVERQSDWGEESASITLRVPSDTLESSMDALEQIGKVTRRNISSKDVTEEYVDIDARLKTKIALRDRLRGLLDKAEDVEDILAIEKELGRVQADIDSMQARLKALKGKVDLATIEVSISRKRILGPVGYVWEKTWWLVEKLFVIQE